MNKWSKVAVILVLSSTAFVLIGQGCGESMKSATGLGYFDSQCAGGSGNVIDKSYEVVEGQRTVGIAYGQQLLDSYVACTGIQQASQRTMDEWMARNQALSEYGALEDVSSATMMAVAAVAAEICQDIVEREAPLPLAQRGIFSSVNLGGAGLSTNEIVDTSRLLALSCWQRPSSAEEEADLVNTISQLNVNSATGAVSLCTSMLASLAAIEQ